MSGCGAGHCPKPPALQGWVLQAPSAMGVTVPHPVVALALAPVTPGKGFPTSPSPGVVSLERDHRDPTGPEPRVLPARGHVCPGCWHPVSTRLFTAPICWPYK